MMDNLNEDNLNQFVEVSNNLQTTITLNNLQPGRTYKVKYAGRNLVYDSGNMFFGDYLQFSNVTTFITATNPDPIKSFTQDQQLYREQVLVDWVGPDFTGGTPITSYTISLYDTVTTSNTSTVISPSLNTYLTPALVPGRLYLMNIKCSNKIGSSEWLVQPISVYPGVLPTRPPVATFPSVTRNTITLTWNPIIGQDTGGTSAQPITVTQYNIFIDDGYGGNFNYLDSTSSSTYTAQNLKSGLPYRFVL